MRIGRRILKACARLLAVMAGLFALHVVLFRFAPVPLTPLMVIRSVEGETIAHEWVALEDMSPHLARAVIAAEDNRFCEHHGVDLEALRVAWNEFRSGARMRGASTISMQTVKNLYLWPGRSYLRKGLEVVLVHGIELAWDKRRIMEVYLNIVELGPGIYGVQAASEAYFHRSASELGAVQAAALVAVLPAPLVRDPTRRDRSMGQRVFQINRRVQELGPLLDCVPTAPPLQQATSQRPGVDRRPSAKVTSEAMKQKAKRRKKGRKRMRKRRRR